MNSLRAVRLLFDACQFPMGNTTKRTLLAGALALTTAPFAMRACGQDESPQKPVENVRAQPLDFDIFKNTIEPIFLKHRLGHARCYGCHVLTNRAFHLEPLAPGATDWTEEQSRKNFQSVSQLVVPGHPESSLSITPTGSRSGWRRFSLWWPPILLVRRS